MDSDFKALQPSFDLAIAEDIGDRSQCTELFKFKCKGKVKLLAKENGIIAESPYQNTSYNH